MKTTNKDYTIHHIIEIKAGKHEMVDYDHVAFPTTPRELITIAHKLVAEPYFLWGYDYTESMIGDSRKLKKEEYKDIVHQDRLQSWEMSKDQSEDDYGYEPDLNPGGGAYYM